MADNDESALIARGAGKWGDPAFPKTDWICERVADLGEPDVTCEMCEYKKIRNVHHLKHPSGLELKVGCICAGHLTGDLEAAKNLDRGMKKAAVRFRNRREAHDREWDCFLKIDITSPSARKALEGIKARALKLAQKASADSDISLDHFELELDAHCLVNQAGEAADEAQKHIQQIEQSLANPCWRDTMKDLRFKLPDRLGIVKIVLTRNKYEVGTKCVGERGMDWLPEGFWWEEDAKRKGIAVLRGKLRNAGYLSR